MWLPGLAALSYWAVWKGRESKLETQQIPGFVVGKCVRWESNQAIPEREPANCKVLNDLRPSPLFWAKEPRVLLWRAVCQCATP